VRVVLWGDVRMGNHFHIRIEMEGKLWAMLAAVAVLALVFFGLDHWTIAWKRNHPTEFAQVEQHLQSNGCFYHEAYQ
jgi:hypothetical protein